MFIFTSGKQNMTRNLEKLKEATWSEWKDKLGWKINRHCYDHEGTTNARQITSRMDDQKEIFLELVLTFCLAKNTFLADINEQGPFESMFMTENRAEIEFLSMASFLKSVFTRVS